MKRFQASNWSVTSIDLQPKLLVLLCLFLLGATAAFSQSADDVIAKYIAALGGKEKILSIHSIYQEGVAVMQNGTEIDSKTYRVQGKLYRQEISFGMGNVVVIITPTQGWSSNPRNGGTFTPINPEVLKNQQWQLDCVSPLVDYAAKGSKVELTGTDTIAGNECYVLKLTMASGEYISYSIDKKTSYILQESRKAPTMSGAGGGGQRKGTGPNGELQIQYSDYQKTTDGFVFPYTIVAAGFGAKTNVEKLEINKDVDVATLSKPAN